MKYAYYFLLSPRPNKQGKHTLRVVIRLNEQRFEFYTPIKLFAKYWNKKSQKIKAGESHYIENQQLLNFYKSRLAQLPFKVADNPEFLTKSRIKEFLFGVSDAQASFYDFAFQEIDNDFRLSEASKRRYKTAINRLRNFKTHLPISAVSKQLLDNYFTYYTKVVGLNQNTIYKDLAIFKTYLNKAVSKGLLFKNPASDVKIKRLQGKREFLTEKELHSLVDLLDSDKLTKRQKNVLRYFLFSCFTGLRYSDIKTLKRKHIKKELHSDKVVYFIEKQQEKTNELVTIPIPEVALKLIDLEHPLPEVKMFNVLSNQYTNRQLKQIMQIAGIEKNITFHSARHTFATFLLNSHVDVTVVQKLVGHKDVKTTLIYAKVLKDSLIKGVKTIDEKFLDKDENRNP